MRGIRDDPAACKAERISYNVHYALCIPHHIIVPETKYIESMLIQVRVPCGVGTIANLRIMLTAVELDHDTRGETDEVDNEPVDWSLAAKMESLSLQQTE
jgi:hypothetical protein